MFGNFLAAGLGGAIGAMLRYGISLLCMSIHWSSHMATFIVNIVGSFILGMLVSNCSQGPVYLLTTVGICGGFTTFSTFSVQSLSLIQEGRWGMAALYILGTLIICIFCAWLGCLAGQKLS